MSRNWQLSEHEVRVLLDELCMDLGLCLPPAEKARMQRDPPTEVDAFTDAVFRAEGLDPLLSVKLRREVRARVAQHFRHSEEIHAG